MGKLIEVDAVEKFIQDFRNPFGEMIDGDTQDLLIRLLNSLPQIDIVGEIEKMIEDFFYNWESEKDDLLQRLSQIESVNGWISVTERLPDFTGEVFTYRNHNITKGFFVSYGPEKPHFFEDDVTHWMPLPPPPII